MQSHAHEHFGHARALRDFPTTHAFDIAQHEYGAMTRFEAVERDFEWLSQLTLKRVGFRRGDHVDRVDQRLVSRRRRVVRSLGGLLESA